MNASAATAGTKRAGTVRFVERLPAWMGSIRFRLTVLYSVLLFGLAAAVVGGLYAGLAHSLDKEPVSQTYTIRQPVLTPEGVGVREDTVRAEFRTLESLVNERALDRLRTYSFGALGLLFVASLGVGWVVAGRVLAPIGRITGVARDIQATDLSRRIAMKGPKDELRDLADTFDAMLARIDDAFEGQRRFIQEASHELRNPLAVMRTNLEVVLADPDATADELRHTATVVARTIERMSRLVDDLLVYARTGAAESQRAPVELGALVHETAEEFTATAERRRIRIATSVSGEPRVLGDRTALKRAVANLVDNAVRLVPAGSTITIGAGERAGWATLSVADEGPGIAADDHEAVFQRFWRRAHDSDGNERRSGLGLAIVRQIVEGHGGHVGLSSEEGTGSTFVLWLPPFVEIYAPPGTVVS